MGWSFLIKEDINLDLEKDLSLTKRRKGLKTSVANSRDDEQFAFGEWDKIRSENMDGGRLSVLWLDISLRKGTVCFFIETGTG